MADDFIGSIAQEDVSFVTEIVKTVNPGDNYKHLAVYTDASQIKTGAVLASVKNSKGTEVGKGAEVSSGNFRDIADGQLLVWLTDYFTAGGNETVFIYQTLATMTEANLTALFDATHQLAYFKTVCIADSEVTGRFQLDADAALWLGKLCGTDQLLSAVPFYPLNTALDDGEIADTAYEALSDAHVDAWWVYSEALADGTVHHGGLVALGIALSVINASGTYAGNSFDMVATGAIAASGYQGNALDITSQSILKDKNIAYFKPVGDSTGFTALRGATSSYGKVIPAEWIVAYCNYMNKVYVANYITQRNVYKNLESYNICLNILATTVNNFVVSGRIEGFKLTAPAYGDLPASASDELVIPNAWSGYYKDDIRKVSVTGTLTI